ncbi:Protein FAM205A [Microtus ochrogaster]|uniref:Protein FAM205A n=1 Tax=Microtus ochrogaster TaxID=79684 RepID=A0A8J6G402_MICOH|nr:Protein FAM205A [Microtus ochrogaster]
MLRSTYFLWDSDYPLYVYIYIFVVILIIWQVQQNYCRLKWEQKRSCCRAVNDPNGSLGTATGTSHTLKGSHEDLICHSVGSELWAWRKGYSKPQTHHSIIKGGSFSLPSQSWLPKEERVRQLLCIDPCCQICDAATLEIRQLLESKQSQISPALLGLPQDSSCLEMLTISSETFEQNVELHPRPSTDFPPAPVTQTLTEHLTQSASTVGVQQLCADHLLAGQGFHLADMSMVSEAAASSRLREPVVLVNAEEMMHSDLSYNYLQQIQDQQSFNSQTPFQTLSPDGIHVTHPMTLSLVTTVPPPFLNPEVWSNAELGQKAHHGQITSPVEKPLFSPDHDILRGIWLLPKGQANDSRNKLPKTFTQLFCGLPSIHKPVRRLLELHLQKQLIHLRWGLPQRIQRSIHLVPSSPGQQPRGALPNVSILQPGDPKADGSGDMFAVAVDRGSVPTPHLFSQAQAMLKTHVDSKYGQIHQGKVPACVQSSRECRIPRSLSVGASFSNIPASRHLELQAKSNPDLQHTAVSQEAEPAALDQEKQASSGTLIEHCKLPQALPEETVKKLETTLRHKYLAFLSGLPVHYCVTPSRSTSPATVSHSTVTEIIPGPVKIPQEPLTQVTLLEDPYRSRLEPCTQDENEASAHIARDDNETSEDIAGEVQPKVQAAGGTEKVPLETQTEILAKLSFHLKKKVLEIKLGFPVIAKEFKESNAVDPEPLGILRIPGSTALPQLPNTGYSPPAPDANRVHLGKRPATAGQAVCHKQKQPSSKTAPHGSAQWGSKASQLRNMTEAQGHCVQLETSGEKPNLEKTFSTEPQSPGKSKYSAHAPTLTEKSHASGKPKAVWDLEEGDAGLGLPLTSGKTHHDRDEELEKRPPPETPQGSSEQRPRSHQPSPQDLSEFEFPDPPPEVLMVIDATQNMQDSLTKVDAIPEPARSAKVPQPVASKTSQGLPFPCTPTQGKPFRGQAWQENISQRQVTPASPHASPSLPETGLKNKMKSFLHSMSPKIKDKTHMEPPVSTPRKVSKPSQENANKDLPQAKNPTKKTKTENCRMPKAQPESSERPVVTSFLTAPHILDSKLGPGSRQHGSVSGPGQPQHCPRHCPRLACATQYRNPP